MSFIGVLEDRPKGLRLCHFIERRDCPVGLIDDNSILMSVKKMCNIDPEDQAFDTDIGILINGEFMTLHQLGIGPDEGFSITDAKTSWTDFSTDNTLIGSLRPYIGLKVRMIFDPPASSVVADAYNAKIHELEWRLNIQAERNDTSANDDD